MYQLIATMTIPFNNVQSSVQMLGDVHTSGQIV